MVPRQVGALEGGYGFLHEERVFKWDTFLKARIGAYILGVPDHLIVHITVIVPSPQLILRLK